MSLINRFSFQQRGVIDLNKQIIKGGVEPEEEIKIEEKDDSQEDSTGETGNDNNDQEGADTANKGVLSTKEGDLAIKNNALANMNLNSQMIPISGSVQGSTANFSRIPISGSNIIPAPNSGSGIVSSVLPGSLAIHPIFNPIEITIDNPDVFDKPDKTEYDENGNQIGIWYNDEGKVERKVQYDENGNKEQETKYDEYEHAIEEAVYNEDEVLQSKTTWEYEGRYDSYPVKTEFVYNNGLLVSETKYFGYYPDRISSQILYNENGNKVSETVYGSDGIKDSEKSFYENGQVKKYTVYSYDGDLETETEYYENGNIKQQSLYDYEGKLETETEYDENGNKVSETEYNSNGSKISDKTFYKNGQVQHEKVYNNYDKLDYEIEYNEEGVKTKGIQYNYNKYSKDVLESKTHNTYENGVKTKSEVYDTDGNLISESVFDEAGNVVSETEYAYTLNDDGTKTVTTTKTVDGNSERVSIKYSADGKILEETTYYKTGVQEYRPLQVTTYNEQGLVESIADYEYGNKKSETVFSYDSNGVKTGSKTYDSKNTLQTENTYYANGNVKSEISYTNKGTVFEECYYYENGNKQCYIKYSLDGIKWDEYYYYENGNEKLYIYYSDNGDKAHETTYLEDGTKESYTTYYDNGKEKFKEIYENGKLKTKITYNTSKTGLKKEEVTYNEDGTKIISTFDSEGVISSEVTYDADGNVLKKATYTNGVKTKEISYTADSYTEDVFDSEGQQTSQTINNADGTTVKAAFANGIKTTEKTYKFSTNLLIGEKTFDTNGILKTEASYIKTEEQDGKTLVTYTDKSGNVIGTSKIYIDANGNQREDYTASDKTKIYRYIGSWDGKIHECQYKANGQVTSEKVYNLNDTLSESYTYEYLEYIDSKNYTKRRKDSKGNLYTEIYENGKKTTSHSYNKSTGAVSTTYYDSNGKSTGTAKSKLSGSMTQSDVTLSYQKIYDGLVNNLDKTLFTKYMADFTTREVINKMAVGSLNPDSDSITVKFIEYAQVGYKGTPEGCDKKYTDYSDTKYADFIKDDIIDGLSDDGYDPEWIKGYHFPASSSLSKTIAQSNHLKSYVKDNIEALINGDLDTIRKNRLDFESKDEKSSIKNDLYYSLHGTDVVDVKLSGTKLTLTIYDLYDFAEDEGGALGKIGAAAQKDGKLIPYFMLIDVTIDLKDYFSTKELQELGIL